MTRRAIDNGPRGHLTGQTLSWLVAREQRLLIRRQWASDERDAPLMEGIKRGLRIVRTDIDSLQVARQVA